MLHISESVFRFSQKRYYLSFLVIALALVSGFLVGKFTVMDRASETAIALQSFVFMLLMVSLPLVLWWFHRRCSKLGSFHSVEQRVVVYKRLILIRFIVVDLNIVLNAILFFLFADKSFFMCAAIAAIFLLFCRPSIGNIEKDLGLISNEELND